MSTPTTDTSSSAEIPVSVPVPAGSKSSLPELRTFAEIVDAVYELSEESQETLLDIIKGQLVQKRRARLVEEVEASRREYREGKSRRVTPEQLMKEILGET